MNTWVVLVSAVLASLTLGVLFAYGICISMFRIFRIHAKQVAAARIAASPIPAPATITEA